MDRLVIEKMQLEDLPQVVELQRTILPYEITGERAMERYRRVLDHEDYCVLAAKEGTEVLGTVTLICCHALADNFLVLEDFVVRPGLTGKGIGSRIMEAVDAFAQEQKCSYAILVSSGFRTDAHRFYHNHGFTDDVRGFRKVYADACL